MITKHIFLTIHNRIINSLNCDKKGQKCGGSSETVGKLRASLKRKAVVRSLQCDMKDRTEARFQLCDFEQILGLSEPQFPPL